MYYRVAIQPPSSQAWQWKSTALGSLNTLVQWLQFHQAPSRDRVRVFSASSREELIEQLARENRGALLASVAATCYLPEVRGGPREAAEQAPAVLVYEGDPRATALGSRGALPPACSTSIVRSIPRVLAQGAAPHAADYPELEADFSADEILRLVALRQHIRRHRDHRDADAAIRRLKFARWSVEHGKLNEGWAPDCIQQASGASYLTCPPAEGADGPCRHVL